MTASQQQSSTPLGIEGANERGRAVRQMFSAIAPRYDLLNHLLSLNLDRWWRRRAVDRLDWSNRPGGRYVDLCAGTFDLALDLARRPGFVGHVVAVDFSQPMLRQGMSKIQSQPIAPACGDALRLPLTARAFDGAMVAFGLRNLADIDDGLREILRLLRPGGQVVILDFAMPTRGVFGKLYGFYFTRLLPAIGRLVSKHSYAYNYLPESVLSFASPADLGARMIAAGFADVEWKRMTAGVVCLWCGRRPRVS
ncbi:MAG: ubiquinone/menaquinone biosynthesis methyltransferase [Gemmatimonadales bacterium]|jgi:demethylmenaquinone methyltransferase/2-methoxy-6-polyprenyl-1,4-benzoquinol methylase